MPYGFRRPRAWAVIVMLTSASPSGRLTSMGRDRNAHFCLAVGPPREADHAHRLAVLQSDQDHRIIVRQALAEPREVRLPRDHARMTRHCPGMALVSPLPKNPSIRQDGRPEAEIEARRLVAACV